MNHYHTHCDDCDADFLIEVDGTEQEPVFCPICAGPLIIDEESEE